MSSYLTKPFAIAVTLDMWWSPLVHLLYAAAKTALGIRPNQAAEVSSTSKCTLKYSTPRFSLYRQRGQHFLSLCKTASLFFWLAWQVRLFTYELQGDVAMKSVGSMLSDVRMKLASGAMQTAQSQSRSFLENIRYMFSDAGRNAMDAWNSEWFQYISPFNHHFLPLANGT